ncbi:MAG: helix-turn-helix domain-containing protein [Candidatus Rokubacteria bacterium]|nr:helix-turn-helix domain-containing protein [Candidatus Rokubacteria bacterium]
MVLLRKVIGDVLRARRQAQHRTLRDVSTAANVSLGYLSEIERGHKEASSELLAAICDALGTGLSDVMAEVAATFALEEQMQEALAVPATPEPAVVGARAAATPAREPAVVTDGEITVSVRSDGPLRTTLTARRTPGPRYPELLVG